MELFYLLSIGMSFMVLLPIVLNEPLFTSNSLEQPNSSGVIKVSGIESSYSRQAVLVPSGRMQVIKMNAAYLSEEPEGQARSSELVSSGYAQPLRSAV